MARPSIKPAILLMVKPGIAYTSAGISKAIRVTRRGVEQALRRLTQEGKLSVLKFAQNSVLYFADQASADAFGAAERRAFTEEKLQQRRQSISNLSKGNDAKSKKLAALRNTVKPTGGTPAPVTIIDTRVSWTDREADYSQAKRIVCKAPTFDARYQIDPATRVVGGFATQGIGRYEA